MDIGRFKQGMRRVGDVAGGIQAGMNGQPFQSRYGAPPQSAPAPEASQMVRSGDDDQFGGAAPAPQPAPWRKALGMGGDMARGIQNGLAQTGPQRPAPQIVNQPTRAILDRGDAVVPLNPRQNSKMRPSAFGQRYGT